MVFEDCDCQLWVGSVSGFDMWIVDGCFWVMLLYNRGGKVFLVLSLLQGLDGDMWVGIFGDGVYWFDCDGYLCYNYVVVDGMLGGNICVISVDLQGVVWVGMQKGVVCIDGDWVQVLNVLGMFGGLIIVLEYDYQGNLWIGIIEGICVLCGDYVQLIDLVLLGGGCSVFGFYQLGDVMWISSDCGFYCWCSGRLVWVGFEQGMLVDVVFQLVLDCFGNVWISSNCGVLCIDMVIFNVVVDGCMSWVWVECYNEIDGMVNVQVNGSFSLLVILCQDGMFWVVIVGGLSMVDLQCLQCFCEWLLLLVVIESVQVDGVLVYWEGLDCNYILGGCWLVVSYVGLSYLMFDWICYCMWLDGLDVGWVECGLQCSVEFVGLLLGDYILYVVVVYFGGSWG